MLHTWRAWAAGCPSPSSTTQPCMASLRHTCTAQACLQQLIALHKPPARSCSVSCRATATSGPPPRKQRAPGSSSQEQRPQASTRPPGTGRQRTINRQQLPGPQQTEEGWLPFDLSEDDPLTAPAAGSNSNSSSSSSKQRRDSSQEPQQQQQQRLGRTRSNQQQQLGRDSRRPHQRQRLQLFTGGSNPSSLSSSPSSSSLHNAPRNSSSAATRQQRHQQSSPDTASSDALIPPAALTARLNRAATWQELGQLLQQYGPIMNAVHVAALLHRLSRVCAGPELAAAHRALSYQTQTQQQQKAEQQQQQQQQQQEEEEEEEEEVQESLRQQVQGSQQQQQQQQAVRQPVSPQQLAQDPPLQQQQQQQQQAGAAERGALVSSGASQRRALGALVEEALGVAARTLSSSRPQELSCCVGALARLHLHPPGYVAAALAASLTTASRQLPPPPQQQQQQQGVAYQPGAAPTAAVAAPTAAGVGVGGVPPPLSDWGEVELLHLAWAAARLGHMPPQPWLDAFEAQLSARLPTLSTLSLSNALWFYAKLSLPPSPALLAAYWPALGAALPRVDIRGLVSVLWAAAALGLEVPPAIMDGLLLETQVKLSRSNPNGLATLGWALCRLGARPRPRWREAWTAAAGAALPGLGANQGFTNIIWALACWQHVPPPGWLEEFCRCVTPFLAEMHPRHLVSLATCLAQLGAAPGVPWCSYALECYHRRLGTASPAESAAMVWALGMMVPASVAAASAGGGEGQGVPSVSAAAASAAGAAAGGGKGGVNGTPGAAAGSGSGRGSSRKNTSVASAASAGAGAGSGGGKVLGQAAAAAAAAAAADAAAGGAQAGAEEEGGINGSGASGSWLRFYRPILLDLAAHTGAAMPSGLGALDLVDVAAGWAGLGWFPGEAWMELHEGAVNAALGELTSTQVSLLKGAYSRLEALADGPAARKATG